ncbi:MAG: segregation/condensation protein A, partial [Verrucomicrobiota bacterium]
MSVLEPDTDPWRVDLPVFEGPLDLLLYLIKREEVDIYEVELGQITNQYLSYLSELEKLDLEIAGEFLVVAANLIYIKSRTLLPVDQQPPEEDVEEEDPRWELIRQLVEYKKFKEAAESLESHALEQEKIFYR